MVEVRVAFTIDSLKLGGAERVLLQWARWCRQEGWKVLVVTRRASDFDAYPLPEGIERVVEPSLSVHLGWLGWFAFPWRVFALRVSSHLCGYPLPRLQLVCQVREA